MKKYLVLLSAVFSFTACSDYSEEQSQAALTFCDCMKEDANGDFDINWAECEIELYAEYNPVLFTDDAWVKALKDKCPAVAERIK